MGKATFPALLASAVLSFFAFTQIAQAQKLATLTPPAETKETSITGYTLDTPIEAIAADPSGAAVLDKDIPGLLENKSYDMFKSMSLKLVASLSSGRLTQETLSQTEADLRALPAPSGQ